MVRSIDVTATRGSRQSCSVSLWAMVTVLSVTLTLLLVLVLPKVFILETSISLMEVDCCFLAVMLLVVLDSPIV